MPTPPPGTPHIPLCNLSYSTQVQAPGSILASLHELLFQPKSLAVGRRQICVIWCQLRALTHSINEENIQTVQRMSLVRQSSSPQARCVLPSHTRRRWGFEKVREKQPRQRFGGENRSSLAGTTSSDHFRALAPRTQ